MAEISGQLNLVMQASETLLTNVPAASAPRVQHNGFDTKATLRSTGTPALAAVCYLRQALVAGVLALDFTALAGVNGGTINATGKKLYAVRVKHNGNDDVLTIAAGSSNGYQGTGTAADGYVVPGGQSMFVLGTAGPNVDGTHKTYRVYTSDNTATHQVEVSLWFVDPPA